MITLPSGQVKYRCLGPCGELYPNVQNVLNHRRGPKASCKGAGHELVVPEDVLQELYPPPDPPPAGEGEGDGADGDKGGPTKDPAATVAETEDRRPPFQVVDPSTNKDVIWMPSAAHTLYDAIRGSERFRFDGSFQDCVIQSFFEFWHILGVEVVVTVKKPAVAQDGHQPEEEKAHA